MKSGGFHHEIWRISWNPWNPVDFRWNPVDFRWNQMFQKSDADVSAKTLLILQGLGWISPEIRRISWTWAIGWWSSIGLSIERPNRYTSDHIHLPPVAAAAASTNRTGTAVYEAVLLCYKYSNHFYWLQNWLPNKYTNILMPYYY